MRRRASSQSSCAKWASLAMSSAPTSARASNSAGAVLPPPSLHLRQPRLNLRQRLAALPCMMSMRNDTDGRTARFSRGLDALELLVACRGHRSSGER
ncbi:MAG: hypothetical protein ACREXU_13015 [Gammaproteobacteria bacterium]